MATYCQHIVRSDIGQVLIGFNFIPGQPATGPSYSCGGEPPIDPEVEIVEAHHIIDLATYDKGRKTGVKRHSTKLPDCVFDGLYERFADDLIDFASDERSFGPDWDDARDRAIDDAMTFKQAAE